MFSSDLSSLQSLKGINRDSALALSEREGHEIIDLFALANRVREKCRGNFVDLCSIVNAKSGACSEDCSFCAQSSSSKTGVNVHLLIDKVKILEAANHAKENGVKRFCIVTSGKRPSNKELDEICGFISEIKKIGLLPCATLGEMDSIQLEQLKGAGLYRYHHNLETSEYYFSEICTTHKYRDKIRTIEAAKSAGLSVCSGGIFGMGESWSDRIDMAFALKELDVDSVPVNFLTPVKGTPLGSREHLNPMEALKIIAIYRLILPEREIRICGGRPQTLREMNSQIFMAGADGLLLGNYLTTNGRNPKDDLQMISDMGLEI